MSYSTILQAVGGAHTGIAPVNLLDIQDVNGNLHYWADRPIIAPVVITGAITPSYLPAVPSLEAGEAEVWAFATDFSCSGTLAVSGKIDVTQGISGPYSTSGILTKVNSNGCGGDAQGAGEIHWGNFVPQTPIPDGATIHSVTLYFNGDGGPSTNTFPSSEVEELSPNLGSVDGGFSAFMDNSTSLGSARVYFVGYRIVYSIWSGGNLSREFPGVAAYGSEPYIPWLLSVPNFTFNRSLMSDIGEFVIQNLSGDTLSRDFERIVRRSTLEGAMFVYRSWQADAESPWLEVHGTLSVNEIGADTAKLKAGPLIDTAQTDTPLESYCETCQFDWGGVRCGATGTTECSYNFQSCQVPRRFKGVLNHYEKNYGEAFANTAFNMINRRRKI